MFYRIAYCIAWPFIKLFYPTKVIGKENIKKGKCIYACNHQSFADAFILGIALKNQLHFLAKKELFEKKTPMSWFMKKVGGIPVSRGQADITAIKTVITTLKNDGQLLVFPQGTRKQTPEDVEALKNGCSIF